MDDYKIKENEITKLTTPLTYRKDNKFGPKKAYDCEGNHIRSYRNGQYVINQKRFIK